MILIGYNKTIDRMINMGLFDSLKETVKNNIQNAVEEEVSKQ